jgi:hypothetical protein
VPEPLYLEGQGHERAHLTDECAGRGGERQPEEPHAQQVERDERRRALELVMHQHHREHGAPEDLHEREPGRRMVRKGLQSRE